MSRYIHDIFFGCRKGRSCKLCGIFCYRRGGLFKQYWVDSKKYLVVDATEESGIYGITLEANRSGKT